MSMENNAPPSDKRPGKRTRNFAILLLILILAAGGCLAWYLLYAAITRAPTMLTSTEIRSP